MLNINLQFSTTIPESTYNKYTFTHLGIQHTFKDNQSGLRVLTFSGSSESVMNSAPPCFSMLPSSLVFQFHLQALYWNLWYSNLYISISSQNMFPHSSFLCTRKKVTTHSSALPFLWINKRRWMTSSRKLPSETLWPKLQNPRETEVNNKMKPLAKLSPVSFHLLQNSLFPNVHSRDVWLMENYFSFVSFFLDKQPNTMNTLKFKQKALHLKN